MKRSQFNHAIRAAAAVVGESEILVIGSQAIHALDGLANHHDQPGTWRISQKVQFSEIIGIMDVVEDSVFLCLGSYGLFKRRMDDQKKQSWVDFFMMLHQPIGLGTELIAVQRQPFIPTFPHGGHALFYSHVRNIVSRSTGGGFGRRGIE